MLIKVCGMRDAENIRQVESLGVDLIGLIFYPKSSRFVVCPPSYLPGKAKRVGVFVNEDQETVLTLHSQFLLNFIQLHGTESPEYCVSLRGKGLNLIKAFSVSAPADLEATEKYEGLCSYFLFDTKCEGHGGSGKQFDWSVLSHYHGKTPFLLSGGISPKSVKELKAFHHERFAGVDLNSCFETAPGMKDVEKLSRFINELRKTEQV
ncbi:phosphoribosylanthranilate isomerase [uncultured Bacteroides sp.]|uniref:phosphoribosylanthranilate isomerase n=1 Tax=uncultured Bacteroides sp. TaxID=162156 RepID=UPI002AA82FF1|nr:phosphoribosylanthranilate isomerase [uncultured Bacteroides sp.]